MNGKTGPDPVKSVLCTALNYSSNLCSESHWSAVGEGGKTSQNR